MGWLSRISHFFVAGFLGFVGEMICSGINNWTVEAVGTGSNRGGAKSNTDSSQSRTNLTTGLSMVCGSGAGGVDVASNVYGQDH